MTQLSINLVDLRANTAADNTDGPFSWSIVSSVLGSVCIIGLKKLDHFDRVMKSADLGIAKRADV
jgi:hypothetical protein